MRVPWEVRRLAARLGDLPVLAPWGRWAYDTASLACARRWNRWPEVLGVSLRGGALRGWRVGVSDLDFTLHLRDLSPEEEQSFLNRFVARYRRTRATLPILGEPVVATQTRWTRFLAEAPAPALWYRRQLRLRDGRWEPEVMATGPVLPASRFAYCFDFYRLALKTHWRDPRGEDPVLSGWFLTQITKAIRHAGGTEATGEPAGYPEQRHRLLALALTRLHDLAQQAMGGEDPPGGWERTRMNPRPASAPAVLLTEHMATLLSREGVATGPGPVPHVYVVETVPEETESAAAPFVLWERLRERHQVSGLPAVFVTEPMAALCRAGWVGWSPDQPLAFWEWGGRGANLLSRISVQQRVHNDLISLPGRYAYFSSRQAREELRRVACEALALRSPVLTRDENALAELTRAHLPADLHGTLVTAARGNLIFTAQGAMLLRALDFCVRSEHSRSTGRS